MIYKKKKHNKPSEKKKQTGSYLSMYMYNIPPGFLSRLFVFALFVFCFSKSCGRGFYMNDFYFY